MVATFTGCLKEPGCKAVGVIFVASVAALQEFGQHDDLYHRNSTVSELGSKCTTALGGPLVCALLPRLYVYIDALGYKICQQTKI
mgnify:CR=1 FL=1